MTKLIILNNKKCQIITDDAALMKKLHYHLSFRIAGAEWLPSVQNGGWDGTTYLLSKGGKFNLGLLENVKAFLLDKGIDYIVEDKRPTKIINAPIDISEKLKEYNLIPRDHQERIANITDICDRGIIRAATGAGKSLCIAMIAAKLNKSTIIYVIGLDLLYQLHNLFSQLFDEKIGYIGNGICDPQRITIASIWTIGRALSIDPKKIVDDDASIEEKDVDENSRSKIIKMLNCAKVHILDECHVASTGTINEIYKNIDPEYIFGCSGTPFRDDNSDLLINGILGEQVIDVPASELIAKGLLAQPIIKFIAVPKMHLLNGNNYQSVYKDYIVENEIRNNLIVKQTQALLDKKYTPLVLFKQIKHGGILLEKFQAAGIKCAALCGEDDLEKRGDIKKMLINKEINVILASTIFDIGLDLKELNALVLCGGGKSSIRTLQRVGRAIRMTPGKKFAAVIDFWDQVKYLKGHSKIRQKIYESEKGFKVIKCKEMK